VATPVQVADVRENTAEPTATRWQDDDIELLIDDMGVLLTSATIWRKKAANYAHLVNVSEAGSSHNYSDLYKNALAMEKRFTELAAAEAGSTGSEGRGHAKVRSIVRDFRE
jgi:hypothetical protein